MHSSNFSSSNGSTEDLFRDSIDSCDNDITEKVGPLPGGSREHPGMLSGSLGDPLPSNHMGTSIPTPSSLPPNMTALHTVGWRAWPSVPWFLGSQSWDLRGFIHPHLCPYCR